MNEIEIKKKSCDKSDLAENTIIRNRGNLEETLEMLKIIRNYKTIITDYWEKSERISRKDILKYRFNGHVAFLSLLLNKLAKESNYLNRIKYLNCPLF